VREFGTEVRKLRLPRTFAKVNVPGPIVTR